MDDGSPSNPSVDLRYQTTAAWRAAHRRRQQELYSTGAVDDKWKDRIILFGVVSVGVFSLSPVGVPLAEMCSGIFVV